MVADNPNIALVVLDTLRADAFDRHFDWLGGRRYDNAWSTSHWTVPAHASLFTGRYGSELGVHGKSKHLDCPEPSLAERLRERGWTTRGYSNNVHVSHWFDFDRGFEEFHHDDLGDDLGFNWAEFVFEHRNEGPERYLKLLREIARTDAPVLATLKQGAYIKLADLGLVDDSVEDSGARDTLEWVRNAEWRESGEFLFLNLMEAHAPYEAPENYRTVEPATIDGPRALITGTVETDVDRLETAYDDCVRYLADVYEEIYRELETEFDVIVTLSDHGEAFGEYGGWEHTSGLWPAVTRIPLTIDTSDAVDDPVETDAPVSLFDVYRTICSYADVEPGDASRGSPLVDDRVARDHHLVETHGLLEKARKRLRDDGFSSDTLDEFDVELRGVAATDGYSFENFDGGITDHEGGVEDAAAVIDELAVDVEPRETGEGRSVPEHVEDRLEDLGYA